MEMLPFQQQNGVEGGFADVNPENHNFLPAQQTPLVNLVYSGSRVSGPKILFDRKEWRKGDTIFSTGYDALAVRRVLPFPNPSVPESSRR
jgi:hypothetical protein